MVIETKGVPLEEMQHQLGIEEEPGSRQINMTD
jgi:hypothetical protein